jgi:ABC-type uncharacterized transport system substrate-binding protein
MVVLLLLALPGVAVGQRPARVGVMLFETLEAASNLPAFRAGLGELGYVEGKTIALEYGSANGRPDRLAAVAAAVVSGQPDAIVVLGGDVAFFAKRATAVIPTVALVSYDPVEAGLVASLARPGGNITGVAFVSSETAGKRVQYIRQMLPSLSRLGVLWSSDHPDHEYRGTLEAARAVGVRVVSLEVRRPEDFDAAFQSAQREKVEAIVVAASRLMNANRLRVMDFAVGQRIPIVSGWGPWVTGGALLSYGPDLDHLVRRAAVQLDRILKGARAHDLPIELPTKLDLVVNAKTARTLGIALPPSLLLQATRVIE